MEIICARGTREVLPGYEKIGLRVCRHKETPTVCKKNSFHFQKGCFFHQCPFNCQKSRQTNAEMLKDVERLTKIKMEVDELVVMRSCQWEKKQTTIKPYVAPLSKFLTWKCIKDTDILEAIVRDEFFGIVKVNVRTPLTVIEKYAHLNFPLIFNRVNVDEDMLSDKMKAIAKKCGRQFPHETMTLTWNGDNLILTSDMAKFYLSIGMRITVVHYAVQYVKGRPFKRFVDDLVQIRVSSIGTNAPLGDRVVFKLENFS